MFRRSGYRFADKNMRLSRWLAVGPNPTSLSPVPGEFAPEHFPEKACPGLDPGWAPVFRRKCGKIQNALNSPQFSRRSAGASKRELRRIQRILNFAAILA